MKLKHYTSRFLALFSVVALLATNLFADNLYNDEDNIFNRNGTSNIGGSIDLTSSFGSTTTLGFGYSHSNSDRSLNLYSSYNAPTLLEQVRLGVHGIDHVKMDPALALHKFSSAAILQMTAPRDRMDIFPILAAIGMGGSTTTTGTIVLAGIGGYLASEAFDGILDVFHSKEKKSADTEKNNGEIKFPDNPKKDPKSYKPIETKGAKENTKDGSIWEKDNSNHGGEQWKRWPGKRAWEKGDKPNSIWPDGTVRK